MLAAIASSIHSGKEQGENVWLDCLRVFNSRGSAVHVVRFRDLKLRQSRSMREGV